MRRLLVVLMVLAASGAAAGLWAAEAAHKPSYPDPSLNGPPIRFFANMSADEESAVTESPATGRAEFVLDRETMKLSWKITFKDLSTAPVAARIHGPQTPGGEAGPLFDLAPNGLKSPLEGSHTLTDGELRYLLTDRLYVNITTQKYKQGEIRGQLQRIRPSLTQ